jgi:hypothetical protein
VNTKETVIKMAAVLAAAVTICAAHAGPGGDGGSSTRDGGSNGSGGNVQKSTRADLEEIVANFPLSVWEISDNYHFGGPIPVTKAPLSPALKKITKAVTGTDYFAVTQPLYEYMRDLKLEISDKPCIDGGVEKDASTENKKNAPVCLSASRLARFPKSVLKIAIYPIIFHEVAHQFGFAEPEANAYQDLADLHMRYRAVYLATWRAHAQCAFATDVKLTAAEQKEILDMVVAAGAPYDGGGWPTVPASEKRQVLTSCMARGTSSGENLSRLYDGNIWAEVDAKVLTSDEKSVLMQYGRYDKLAFNTMIKALAEPPITGDTDCPVCKAKNLDPAYIVYLGGKLALSYLDQTVGKLQSEIVPHL